MGAKDDTFRRAQRNYDAQVPPDYWGNCEEDGHEWIYVRSSRAGDLDDMSLYRCRRCGKEDLR